MIIAEIHKQIVRKNITVFEAMKGTDQCFKLFPVDVFMHVL